MEPPKHPPLPPSISGAKDLTSEDVRYRSLLSWVFGWLQGASAPDEVLAHVADAIIEGDKLLARAKRAERRAKK